MKLSCEVIKDLLPLYYDKVCSKESYILVENHLLECPTCKNELDKLQASLENSISPKGEINAMKNISNKWKRDKRTSFAKGATLISAIGAISSFALFNIIGSEVLPDGTLVEPFALIPIGYMFILLFIVSLLLTFIFSKKVIKH